MTKMVSNFRLPFRFKTWARRLGLVLLGLFLVLFLLDRIFPPPLERASGLSVMVTDRSGTPLRAFPTKEGRWRFGANLETIDPLFIEALLKVEDKRFYRHVGVDPLAMMRASATSLAAGRIVSGASTITCLLYTSPSPRDS